MTASPRRSPARLRLGEENSTRRWTSSPSAMPEETAGDLAIVLHSHMPYVEGFGTYPFGEEWLFDAVIRSYLPVLEVARDLTMTVTPCWPISSRTRGVRERLRDFLVEWRIGAAEADLSRCRPSAGTPARRSWRATGTRWSCSTAPAAIRCAPSRRLPRRAGSRWRRRPRPTPSCRCSPPGPGCACSSTPASARTVAVSAGTAASGCPSAPTRRGSSGGWPSTA